MSGTEVTGEAKSGNKTLTNGSRGERKRGLYWETNSHWQSFPPTPGPGVLKTKCQQICLKLTCTLVSPWLSWEEENFLLVSWAVLSHLF